MNRTPSTAAARVASSAPGAPSRRFRRPPAARRRWAGLEALEGRCLLTGPGVILSGVPTWIAEGPAPNSNGQDANVPAETGGGPNGNPVTGAVEAIAVNPGNPNNVFVGGVNGGIWETTNISANPVAWVPLTDQFKSLQISSIQFDPTDATNQTLVAGLGNVSSEFTNLGPLTGLLKSTNDGGTWAELGDKPLASGGLQGQVVSSVLPRGNTILVGVRRSSPGGNVFSPSPGLFRSVDGGQSFQPLSGLNNLGNGQVFDVAGDPGNANRAYVVVGGATGGVFRTDDLGNTWNKVSSAAMDALLGGAVNNSKLSVSAAAPNPVYMVVADNGQISGIFRSANPGAAFTAMDLPQTLDAPRAINAASNTTPIVITTAVNHGYRSGERVRIAGSADAGANGDWTITVNAATPNQFTLVGSVADGGGGAGGTARIFQGASYGGQASTHMSLLADPGNANRVYVGGDDEGFPRGGDSSIGTNTFTARIFRGDATVPAQGRGSVVTDATHQWTPVISSGTTNNSAPHADTRYLVLDNGQLLYAGDGGLFIETSPTDATGRWLSKNGAPNGANNGLQLTQFASPISYDTLSNIIFGGAQDTGTPQQSATGSMIYNDQTQADGPFTAIDNLSSNTQSSRYIGFTRFDYNAANTLLNAGGAALFPAAGVNGFTGFNALAVSTVAPPAGQSARLVIANGSNPAQPGVSGIFESTNATSGAITYTQVLTGAGWNGLNVFNGSGGTAGIFAITIGGTRGGVVNQNVIYAGSGSQVFLRSTAGGTLTATSALPAGAGTIQAIATDPSDWQTAYVTDGTNIYVTTNAGTNWAPVTGLTDNNIHTLTVVDGTGASAGVTALLAGETNGVFRELSNAPNVWTKYGPTFPDSSVWGVAYSAAGNGTLVVGTSGRGAFEAQNVNNTLFTPGILTITGDQDFPNENDTIRLVIDPGNPLLLDVYLNSAAPVCVVPLSAVQKIVVNSLGGNDNLIVDRTNGDPIAVPGGVAYDGGTHTPPGVDQLTIIGAGAQLATFTRDPVTPDAGTLAVDGSTITFVNSQLTNINNVVQLTILGTNAATGTYSPDGATANAGTFVIGAATIKFTAVTRSTASDVATFTVITPNDADVETVDSPAAGRNRVQGTSGGVAFTPLTFFNMTNFTLDSLSKKVGGLRGDQFTVTNPGGPALQASGLQNFTILSGPGNDVLTVNADDYRLPVAGGKFLFNPGTGTYTDGTPASNLRGLISLDRVVATGNINFALADKPHVLIGGGAVPDDTAPGQTLTATAAGGADRGVLTMIGVEAAVLTGGPATTAIDASAFGGATVLHSGGGTTVLTGGPGTNVIYGGAGTDTLIAGPARPDGQAPNLLGGGGVDVLIGGPGNETFLANPGAGTTTMLGGSGANAFKITNPAGTVDAPVGGFDVIGGTGATNALTLTGGGGAGFRDVYTVGTFPAAPGAAFYTLSSLGLDVPALLQTAQYSGVITTANSFATSGASQPVTQTVRVSGLSAITDAVTARSLYALGTPGSGFAVGAGNNLAGGVLHVSTTAGAFTPVTFSNKTVSAVFGTAGVVLASNPTPLPASASVHAAPAAVARPAVTVKAAVPQGPKVAVKAAPKVAAKAVRRTG